MIFRFLIVLLWAALWAAPDSAAQQLKQDIRARYGESTTFTAHFNQHVTSAFLDSDERYSGRLWLRGPAYRVETGGQTIVSDGEHVWIHNIAEKQVLLSLAEDNSDDFSLVSFLSEFDTAYESAERPDTTIQNQRLRTLELTPTDPFATFQTVTMWARPRDAAVVRLRVVDQSDVVMHFTLSDLDFPDELPDATFQFDIPDGVELVDLR
ncbi:MAG: hypothetical protein COV99_00900 [Bacteroidetes bacterium CG12_big_fil_rev_8_21_14_0_65_60_17]|nr:MAG: hypothetical protein COV99_00900 [Bacteroidetes bacterium CG12_big_fil_rev_8_21_14_0_65_60_17]